jgi:hypothetical protein
MANISRVKPGEISDGNTIFAEDLEAEFDQLINAHNTNDTILSALVGGAYTMPGPITFTNGPLTNTISERTAGSGVTIDSVRNKDGMVKVSGTPTEAGEVGYASNRIKYHNGTTVVTVPDYGMIGAVTARSSNTILAAADQSTLFVCTSTFTQTLTAAATLGSGWYCHLRNDGTGVITIDPNSSETVNGRTTLTLMQGQSGTLVCDGSNFKFIGGPAPGQWETVEVQTPSGVSSVDFLKGFESGYDHKWVITQLNMASDAVGLDMRVSIDGSAFRSTAGDYAWQISAANNGPGTEVEGNVSDTEIVISSTSSTNSDLGDAAGEPPHTFVIEGFDLDNDGSAKKHFNIRGNFFGSVGRIVTQHSVGFYDGTTDDILGVRFLSSANFSGTIRHYRMLRA